MRLPCDATLDHPLAAVIAHGLAAGAALRRGDEAVVIRVETGEGLFGPGLDISDDDRPAGLHTPHAALAMAGTATGVHRADLAAGAGFTTRCRSGVELSAGNGTIVVGVQPGEASVGAASHSGLHGGVALVDSDRAVPVGIDGGQSLNPTVDELGLAEAVVAVRVSTHGAGRVVRRLLGDGDAAGGGERQSGQAADQNGFVHLEDLHGRLTRLQSLSGD